jgi:hypothetical protein
LRRNSEQTDQWQRRTHELTEQGQITDRYTKAVEQLDSDKLDVRIDGIYALERIARDSAKDHPTVMEVLTAFIREHSREQWPPSDAGQPEQDRSTRPDVQAAVTVVGRRDTARDILAIDLRRANLTRANLTRADLTRANLTRADLTRANLNGAHLARADLTSAHLADAHLGFADLADEHLVLADLSRANLGRANLTRVRWPAGAPVPDGWMLDSGSGRLRRAGRLSGGNDPLPLITPQPWIWLRASGHGPRPGKPGLIHRGATMFAIVSASFPRRHPRPGGQQPVQRGGS